jgi:broad specificity phosphatase PhoE
VVSHSVFIHIMVSYLCKGGTLRLPDLLVTFFHIERMKNASIIHLEYNGAGAKNTCRWRLIQE